MALPAIGREVVAAGLALDAVGALFLGRSVMRTPTSVASELFQAVIESGEILPGRRGRTVNHVQVEAVATEMLCGRLGMALLALGFAGQLVGGLLPTTPRIWLPIGLAVVLGWVVLTLGGRWVRRRSPALHEEVLRSPTHAVTGGFDTYRSSPRTLSWSEPRFFQWLLRRTG